MARLTSRPSILIGDSTDDFEAGGKIGSAYTYSEILDLQLSQKYQK